MEMDTPGAALQLTLKVIHDFHFPFRDSKATGDEGTVNEFICEDVIASEIQVAHLLVREIAYCPDAAAVSEFMEKTNRVSPLESPGFSGLLQSITPVNTHFAVEERVPRYRSAIGPGKSSAELLALLLGKP